MDTKNVKEITFGALKRTSSAISLIILVAFIVMILSTAYNLLAFTPAGFIERSETQQYKKNVEKVLAMDEWTRTQYYWSNNLKVAGVSALGVPIYSGFNSVVATNYFVGVSLTYRYYQLGAEGALAFSSIIFVHGLFELTGFYIIAAASLRVAWNFWKGLGYLMAMAARNGKHWSWGLSKFEKQEILRHRGKIKELLADFITLFLIGALLVVLAAPIEAYVTPWLGAGFFGAPMLSVAFLAAVGLMYAALVAYGFNAMRKDTKFVWENVKAAFKGRWRPAQLSILMFVVSFLLMLVHVLF